MGEGEMEHDENPYVTALREIEEADYSGCEYRTARRLLDLAHPATGTVRLEAEVAYWLCGVTSWGAVRRMLGALQAMDLIRYRAARDADAGVDVVFAAWDAFTSPSVIQNGSPVGEIGSPDVPPFGSPVIQIGSPDDGGDESVIQNGSPARRIRSPVIQKTQVSSHAHLVGLVGNDPFPDHEKKPTNQPTPSAGVCARVRGLLTDLDVGLSHQAVDRLPAIEFRMAVQITFAWLDLYRRKKADMGLLLWRLENQFGAQPLRDEDRTSELCRRHVPEAYRAPAMERNYLPDEYADIIIG